MDGKVEQALGMTGELLRAEALRRSFGGRMVVDIDLLSVSRGEVLAVLGPNGAGKSTLFRILLLLERPDAGRLYLDGRAVVPPDRQAALRLAGVFQRPFLFAGTVEANAAFGLRARGVAGSELRRRVDSALRAFGLSELAAADVRTLSGGEAQRLAVARAMAVEPDVLLLDEPTAGLDIPVRRSLREDLERAVRLRGGAVLIATHDPADAFALADRIAVMEGGRLVQVGVPDDLVLEPATPFVAAFAGAELLVDGIVETMEGGLVQVRTAGGTTVWGVSAETPLRQGEAAHASYRPEDVTIVAENAATATSAINRFRMGVASAVTTGALVRVRLKGTLALTALVTRRSAEVMHLVPGTTVEAHLKATAVRVYRAGTRQ
jgi:molybdopterin-binding protein